MRIPDLQKLIAGSTIHTCLYHFTDLGNLESIRTHGLSPKDQFDRLGITPSKPGGNPDSWHLDKRKGIFGYVSLCLTGQHPMCYHAQQKGRIGTVKYLKISSEVLSWDGVHFAFDIANKNGVDIQPLESAIGSMDLDVLYNRTNWKDPDVQARLQKVKRYEVLVPHVIPPTLIAGL